LLPREGDQRCGIRLETRAGEFSVLACLSTCNCVGSTKVIGRNPVDIRRVKPVLLPGLGLGSLNRPVGPVAPVAARGQGRGVSSALKSAH